MHAKDAVLEQALDHETSFGDEEALALEGARIADKAIGFEHRHWRR
jgi:hypothetical protein